MGANKILVVPTVALFESIPHFHGFKAANSSELDKLEVVIRSHGEWKERLYDGDSKIEHDFTYKQIIPYGVIITNDNDALKILLYPREKGSGDSRLWGKTSIGIGGHIESQDSINLRPEYLERKLKESIEREIKEEITASKYGDFSFLGFLNDDTQPITEENFIYGDSEEGNSGRVEGVGVPIGYVHFGLVYLLKVSPDVKTVEAHQKKFKLITLDEIGSYIPTMETWSRILAPEIKRLYGGFF